MRDEWGDAFRARAAAYWTAQRIQGLTSGKQLWIQPDTAPVLLRALGLLHRDASMPPAKVRKFRQINHMVSVLGPALRELRDRHTEVHILDVGCGSAYLTTLLAWVFRHVLKHPVRVLGLDRNEALIDECRRRAELVQLDYVVKFAAASIDGADIDELWAAAHVATGSTEIHALVALHACDTATDDAIALGLAREIALIAVAPCCQAELSAKWAELSEAGDESAMSALWRSPHLRRHAASTVTDALRTLILQAAGYFTTALEFVPSEHTPKNTLIRAMRRADRDLGAATAYRQLREASGGAALKLEEALPTTMRAWLLSDQRATSGE